LGETRLDEVQEGAGAGRQVPAADMHDVERGRGRRFAP
jgi:hypothetical protein